MNARLEAETDFSGRMSYGDYLDLDAVLSAQRPLSDAHDELLFIIQHQTSELWMKLAIHELDAAREAIATDRLDEAFKLLARVSRIFEQLNGAWDVLRTMTPSDYTTFRGALGQSSGFQSFQYRRIEFILGNRNRAMLKPHAHRSELVAELEAELGRPDLYVIALQAAARAGLPVPPEALAASPERRVPDPRVTAISYLRRMLEVVLFPELWDVRTTL
jgi:tryptophan 2,3-dioxygenase